MDLIVHSLYSHKEVFLRELVSNASDALDKLRFLSVTDPSMLADGSEMEIRIKPDPEAGTITITDSGIGMTKDELKDCLGTIAQSGTSKFLKALKENKELGADNGLIGQFGVGFYSAFLVAEKIVVSTKSPKVDKQYVWEAEANSSSYVIKEETDPEKMLTRGTQITPFLRVMLLGHSDSYLKDKAMQVTIAFNHFGEGLIQRMPRCRHGYFHVVNNDYTHWEMYAIGGSAEPTINSQGNRYLAPTNPFAKEVQYPYQCTIITVNWFSDQHFSFFIFHYAIFHLLTVGAEEPGDQPDSAPV